MNCDSSIVTGYDEDVVMGVVVDTLKTYNFQFSNTRKEALQTDR